MKLSILTAGLILVAAQAWAQDTLRDLVRRHGGRFETTYIAEYSPAELPDLIRESGFIARVLVAEGTSRLSRDERRIETDYTLVVLEAYQGDDAIVGKRVTVVRPLGSVELEGHVVRATESGFAPFLAGEEYVLFMVRAQNREHYLVNYGGQGAFLLDAGVARQATQHTERPDVSMDDLIGEIRKLSDGRRPPQ